MPFAIPLVAKIVADLATSEASATGPTAQKTDTDKTSSAPGAGFAQAVDNVSQAAAGVTQGAHTGRS